MKNWLSVKTANELKNPTGFSCQNCQKPNRCCDFTPFIPNFLVGEILRSSASHEMRGVDFSRMTPLGLFPGTIKPKCDFFDEISKGCKIWKHRPSECASYYCEKFEDQDLFKNQSKWLFEVEMNLAQLALVELGFTHLEVSDWVSKWNQWQKDPKHNVSFEWPKWVGDQNHFYNKCSNWFQSLEIGNFLELLPKESREGFDKHLLGSYGA